MVKYAILHRKKLKEVGKCTSCGKYDIAPTSTSRCILCLEKRRKEAKIYREANPDKVRKVKQKWEKENVEKVRSIKRKVHSRRKDKAFEEWQRRRARKSEAGGFFTKSEWIALLKGSGGKCISCGSSENMEADHVVPIAKGGNGFIHNIQPLCRKCNRKKFTKILDFRPFGSAILDWT